MRATTLFILAAILVATPFSAASGASMKDCAANWKSLDAATKAGESYKTFMSGCLKGGASSTTNSVGSAAGNTVNSATNAVGNAGNAVGHAATNAWHGAGNAVNGATNAAGSATKAAGSAMGMNGTKTASHSHSKIPVEGNTGTAARCNDGTTMQIHTHSGACSHHGGVAAWL